MRKVGSFYDSEPGTLIVTNLRIIWSHPKSRKSDVSIGLQCCAWGGFRPDLRNDGTQLVIKVASNEEIMFAEKTWGLWEIPKAID